MILVLLALLATSVAASPHYICARGDTRVAPANTLPAVLACFVELDTIYATQAGPVPRVEVSMMVLADKSVLLNHDEQVIFDARQKLVIQNPTAADITSFPLINIRTYTRDVVSTWHVIDRSTHKTAKLAFLDELLDLLQVFSHRPFILDFDIKDAEYFPPDVAAFVNNLTVTDTASLSAALSQLTQLLQADLPNDVTSNSIVSLLSQHPDLFHHSLLESTNPLIEFDLYFLSTQQTPGALLAFNYGDWGSSLLNTLEVTALIPTVQLELALGLTQAIFFEDYLTIAGGSSIVSAYHDAGVTVIGVPKVSNNFTVLASYGVDYVYFNF